MRPPSGVARGIGPFAKDADRYFGKYEGFIRDANDPDNRGRLRCYCPTVMGEVDSKDKWLDWALPSFPWLTFSGVGKAGAAGFIPAASQPGADKWGVHIEFLDGDVRHPVWTGVFPLAGQKVNYDELSMEAVKKLSLKVGSNLVEIDGDNGLIKLNGTTEVQVNGSLHPLPKWNVYEAELATFLTSLIGVLQAGTQGTPVAQQLVGLPPVQAALQAFITKLGNQTFDSTKAKNG